ncbi:hypothetical protein NDU88_005193 [Pleurodeles waltl]|uniref:Uncharacterized protein n=1 Tax=Pleurodeles waltl TaxID=8319 RepID=A0AAV7L3N5_PLEWA|nr:hypothetical protein NDU88_005193 [Pleurodeles waltl]
MGDPGPVGPPGALSTAAKERLVQQKMEECSPRPPYLGTTQVAELTFSQYRLWEEEKMHGGTYVLTQF